MRNGTLLLAFVFAATAPMVAQGKTRHHHYPVAPAPVAAAPDPIGNPFIVDGLRQIFVPFQVTLQALQPPPPAPPPVRHRHGHRV